MLVEFVNTRGKRRWINAAYVKTLNVKGSKTEIYVSGGSRFLVDQPAGEVAALLNTAMPTLGNMLAPIETDRAAQEAAAAAAAV